MIHNKTSSEERDKTVEPQMCMTNDLQKCLVFFHKINVFLRDLHKLQQTWFFVLWWISSFSFSGESITFQSIWMLNGVQPPHIRSAATKNQCTVQMDSHPCFLLTPFLVTRQSRVISVVITRVTTAFSRNPSKCYHTSHSSFLRLLLWPPQTSST